MTVEDVSEVRGAVTPALPSLPRQVAAGEMSSSREGDPLFESPATLDVFALGRRAAAARDARWGATASFVRARAFVPGGGAVAGTEGGSWRGPRDAAEAFVELGDLAGSSTGTGTGTGAGATHGATHGASDDGWSKAELTRASAAGVTLWLGAPGPELHRALVAGGGRVLYRFGFRAGEPAAERRARLDALQAAAISGAPLWGVMPTPLGEAEGIDTLRVVAALRLDLPSIPHVVLDVAALGPRLAQMALGFGGDELWAPIVSERALRLGGNANNPAMTRKEACILIRGAGLRPRERVGADRFAEEPS
jgi:hypothetical protein